MNADTKFFQAALEEHYQNNPADRRMFHEMEPGLQSSILDRSQRLKDSQHSLLVAPPLTVEEVLDRVREREVLYREGRA